MRLSMNKEDICKPIKIPKEKRNEFLSTIIKSCISNSNIIGENLEKECIDYFELLETNRDEAIELLRSNNIEVLKYYDEPSETGSYELVTIEMLSLLERGKE